MLIPCDKLRKISERAQLEHPRYFWRASAPLSRGKESREASDAVSIRERPQDSTAIVSVLVRRSRYLAPGGFSFESEAEATHSISMRWSRVAPRKFGRAIFQCRLVVVVGRSVEPPRPLCIVARASPTYYARTHAYTRDTCT